MKLALCAVACVACSTQDNLGNHVFGEARWSISLGTAGEDSATAITVDAIGNVIVAGTCDGELDFGSGAVECYGTFITQRSSETGAEMWTVRISDARVTSLAHLGDKVVATGVTTESGAADQFIATFDTRGTFLTWSAVGMAGYVVAPIGAIASDGRVFATGGFQTAPNTDTLTNTQDAIDGYLSSHHRDGTHAWATPLVGEGRQIGTRVAVNADHDVAIVVDSAAPMQIGNSTLDAPEWPAQLLVWWSPQGKVMWSRPIPEANPQIALTPDGDVIVGACPYTYLLDAEGEEQWRVDCKDKLATVDTVAVSPDGLIVLGGHHADAAAEDGELFLIAFDRTGSLISSAISKEFPEPSDSRVDAIAVEPTGEVVFVTTASHAFDFGNGVLPHAGAHDVIIAKLDSTTGRDGQVVLTRPAP